MGTDNLIDNLQTLDSELAAREKPLQQGRKIIKTLVKAGALDDIALVAKEIDKLQKLELPAAHLQQRLTEVTADVDHHVRELKQTARARVLGGVNALAAENGLSFKMLGDSPPSFILSPFTIELDIAKGVANLQYAREHVLKTSLDATAIVAGHARAKELIHAGSVESRIFFDLLHLAYKTVLLRTGARAGERVDLVDLLAPLALLRVDPQRWRTVSMAQVNDFPRYLLAYQFTRLRRDGLLAHKGVRVELGTATGGSTRNKKNVLFVPTAPADGQYYLSIRMVS